MPTHRLLPYRLSLNLGKSHFFPRRFEFVGSDVCSEGNCPAKSKHQLLETWPAPELVRDVAKFLGFVQFYSRFIRISPFPLAGVILILKTYLSILAT